MKRDLINLVKYSKVLYGLYYYCGSFAVKLMGLFVKMDKKKILFSSFGGRKYDDSPRCIFEKMRSDPRFADYRFVWALGSPQNFEIKGASKVKCDTISYYKELLSSSVWVTNSTMERGLFFKPSRILNLNTWHGTAIKRMGTDIGRGNSSFMSKGKGNHDDIMLAQGQYDVDIFSRVFGIPSGHFRITGLPRNDELVNCNTEENRKRIRGKMDIKTDKKVILYAPTFREYEKNGGCIMSPPIDLNKWEQLLGDNYVLFVRAHYEVLNVMKFEETVFVKDVSLYPNLNELMIVSDLLISDYSSIFIDYSLLDKPMLCFAYDYDKYATERGLYFDIREKLECSTENEDELIQIIKELDWERRVAITRGFRERFIEEAGSASSKTVDIVWNYLNGLSY